MNRFIRKNLFLVGVMGLSVLGVVVLLVLSVTQYIEMSKYISKTAEMRKKNETLMRQRPPAVQENIELVQKDITGYALKAEELKNYFGHPLYPALVKFCAELKVTPDELRKNFREFWEKEKESQGPREQTYRRYRATCGVPLGQANENAKKLWEVDAWNAAMEVFVEAAQSTTMEKIDDRNSEEIFLSALGLPRNLGKSQLRLEAFARDMQAQVVDLLTEKNDISMLGVYFNQHDVAPIKSNKDFVDQSDRRKDGENSTSGGGSASPAGESSGGEGEKKEAEPSDVIRNWEIICDLAQRMVKAKIDSVEEISYKDMVGREDSGCRFYTYTVSLIGSEKELRTFLNLLNNAYTGNRVYVVRNIVWEKQEDQIQDIIDAAQGILGNQNEEAAKLASRGNDENVDFGGGNQAKQQQLQHNYYVEVDEYKECVAGRSNVCSATIVLDYVVYSGNILK